MKATELRRRLLVVGAVEVPTSYPPGLAERWAHYRLGGRVFEVPAVDNKLGSEDASRDVVREIRRLAGVRLDWPEWLDGPVDRCPVCGGQIVVEVDADGWEVGCVAGGGCPAVYAGAGAVPTWAEWQSCTAAGRWALHLAGHPLGVAR